MIKREIIKPVSTPLLSGKINSSTRNINDNIPQGESIRIWDFVLYALIK